MRALLGAAVLSLLLTVPTALAAPAADPRPSVAPQAEIMPYVCYIVFTGSPLYGPCIVAWTVVSIVVRDCVSVPTPYDELSRVCSSLN
ncbi:MAG: hypothetical protein LC624_07425 [Halobacteriales archaeon]|nr:hypothetical protein [Halobacteriales archaeon]